MSLAIGAVLLLGVLAFLRVVAPRTKNQWDDKAEAVLEAVEPTLEAEAKK